MNKEEEIKVIPKTIPCECNTGKAKLIKYDIVTNRLIYYCDSCNSYTYV